MLRGGKRATNDDTAHTYVAYIHAGIEADVALYITEILSMDGLNNSPTLSTTSYSTSLQNVTEIC